MEYPEYRNKVIELGEEAFEDIIIGQPKEITDKKPLMIEYARYGVDYERAKVRFMVVGRAAGVFEEKSDFSVVDYGNMVIDEDIIGTCFDRQHNNDKLEWIHNKPGKKKYERFLDSKNFYRFAKRVYLKLTNQDEEVYWYKNICHSNIYKITPTIGGNPSWPAKCLQEKKMIEIMGVEFKHFKPTHILVIDSETDDHCWCLEDNKNLLRGYASECGAKIWFSNRPEFKSREKFEDMLTRIDKDFWTIE